MDGGGLRGPERGAGTLPPVPREPAVRKSDEPLEDVTTSPNGFLTDKDSGGMFYVIRLS